MMKIMKVSDEQHAASDQQSIQIAVPHKHYGLSAVNDHNDDKVPEWMDAALKHRCTKPDVSSFDGIWP